MLRDLKLRRQERFLYEYDFGDYWIRDIRLEAVLSQIETAGSLPLSTSIEVMDRACDRIEDVGLHLEEASSILSRIQADVVRHQLAAYLREQRHCPQCHHLRVLKGYHRLSFRSAFGDVSIEGPRWLRCACEANAQKIYSPLWADSSDSERRFTETGLHPFVGPSSFALSRDGRWTIVLLLHCPTMRAQPVENGCICKALGQAKAAIADPCFATIPAPSLHNDAAKWER